MAAATRHLRSSTTAPVAALAIPANVLKEQMRLSENSFRIAQEEWPHDIFSLMNNVGVHVSCEGMQDFSFTNEVQFCI